MVHSRRGHNATVIGWTLTKEGPKWEMTLESQMSEKDLLMETELHEAPHVVARQPELLAGPLGELLA